MVKDGSPGREEIERQLERILASPDFEASGRLSGFLRFSVEETLAGRGGSIKGYIVATRVFDRPDDFDSAVDPIVRIQAGRLRRRLDAYYYKVGAADPIQIMIPKGRYKAAFAYRSTAGAPAVRADTGVDTRGGGDGASSPPTIAVLPFANLGGTDDAQLLADGITEELTVGFTCFVSLAVICRQSTQRYRDSTASIEEVARELSVRFVVTGSVRRFGDVVKVAAQLTDAESSSQLWAQTIECDLSTIGIFEIEKQITGSVLSRIGDEVGAISRQLALESKSKRPRDLSSYEATLLFYRYNSVEPSLHAKTIAALEKAVMTEPDYALAWAQLAEMYIDSHQLRGQVGYETHEDPLKLAHRYAHHAINLDPVSQQGYASLAYVHFALGRYQAAIESAERAIEINPNSSFLVAHAAFWIGLAGELERGAGLIDNAKELNPNQAGWLQLVPLLLYLERGEYAEALRRARRFRTPALAWGPLLCAATAALAGEDGFAASSYREFADLFPEVEVDPGEYMKAFVHSEDHFQTLLGGLERARNRATR